MPALVAHRKERQFDKAFHLVQDLLQTIYDEFMKWNAGANLLQGWVKPKVIAEHNVYLEKPLGVMEQGGLADVEVSIHSLSAQVVTAKVSSAAPASIVHGIISKSFDVPAANQLD